MEFGRCQLRSSPMLCTEVLQTPKKGTLLHDLWSDAWTKKTLPQAHHSPREAAPQLLFSLNLAASCRMLVAVTMVALCGVACAVFMVDVLIKM
jgi:hypothetical protein